MLLISALVEVAKAIVRYGAKNEHCFSGDSTAANAFSRLT